MSSPWAKTKSSTSSSPFTAGLASYIAVLEGFVLIAILAVSIWTPLTDPGIARPWFSRPDIALLAPVPVVTLLIAFAEWYALNRVRGVAIHRRDLRVPDVVPRHRHQSFGR